MWFKSHLRNHVVQPKKILHRKAPIPERFRGFFVPRFWGANKKIFFFARRTWTTDPHYFRRLLRDVFSRKPPFFVSQEKFLWGLSKNKDDLPACSRKRFSLHFRANLTWINNTVIMGWLCRSNSMKSALFYFLRKEWAPWSKSESKTSITRLTSAYTFFQLHEKTQFGRPPGGESGQIAAGIQVGYRRSRYRFRSSRNMDRP